MTTHNGLDLLEHIHSDPGIQHDSYDNGAAAAYVDLDVYIIELRRLHPNTWYQYLSTTSTISEPFIDSIDAARVETSRK